MLLTDDKVQRLMATLRSELKLAMSQDPQQRARTSLQNENTYVRALLDGTGWTPRTPHI